MSLEFEDRDPYNLDEAALEFLANNPDITYNSEFSSFQDSEGNYLEGIDVDGTEYRSSYDEDDFNELKADSKKLQEAGFEYNPESRLDLNAQKLDHIAFSLTTFPLSKN